ncbi:MAG: YcgN family cysteine cluster protein [Alphaproteobacteria bacterium]|nr:YcgN family cysteine cluster protein [Alphaproteobacteria bacterium]
MSARPFWETVPLQRMNREQWESICDGCGKCCVHKLEDEETGEIFPTNVCCRLLDTATARCSDYRNRKALVPDCVRLTPHRLDELNWLPDSCSYLRVHRGQGLAPWHHLISGDRNAIHRAGQSVAGRVLREDQVGDLEDHIIDKPL